MLEWPALLVACILAIASLFALWWLRKERSAGVRLNFFSLAHPDGQPFPPFGKADFVVPALLALGSAAFLVKFLGMF